MPTATMERQELHKIIDFLPDYKTTVLYNLASVLYDDEPPLTEDELEQLAIAKDEIARGEVITWEELKRELAELP